MTRGTPQGAVTDKKATAVADDRGVAGIVIQVQSIDRVRYTPGLMALAVEAQVDNPKEPGAKTMVTAADKIRTTAALPPNYSLVADPTSLTGVDATTGKTVTLTLKDSSGRPLNGKNIQAVSSDVNKCTVDPAQRDTDADGKAVFTVKKAASAQTGDSAQITFSADGAQPVNVSATVA